MNYFLRLSHFQSINTFSKTLILTWAILCTISCSTQPKSETETAIIDMLEQYKKENKLNKKIYLFTSLDGCGACLNQIINFIEKNNKNTELLSIISSKSIVKIKNKLSKNTIDNNIIIDSSMISLKNGLANHEHPVVYLCKSGSIVKKIDFTYLNAESSLKEMNKFISFK